MSDATTCTICEAPILATTAAKTGGKCMPCANGTRYRDLDYLSIEDFMARASHDYCLAPNLEPHPTNAGLQQALTALRDEPGVELCVIPVPEYEDEEARLDPYSDRVLVAGPVAEAVIEAWAGRLDAQCYREERPGQEVPLAISGGRPVWFVVWD